MVKQSDQEKQAWTGGVHTGRWKF